MNSKSPDRVSSTRKGGMVLVLVVILLGLVVTLVIEGQFTARATLRREEARLRTERLRAATADAARQMLQRLADDDNLIVDHLDEPWAEPVEMDHPSGLSVWARAVDLNRFFDANNLHIETTEMAYRPASEVMMDLMTLCGDFSPLDRVQSLQDWIDPDEDGFRENSFYAQLDPPYSSPDRWLEALSEVLYVEGFSREYFDPQEQYKRDRGFHADIMDCLTVYPGRRSSPVPVNVNTASREVLLGIVGLLQEEWVRYILVLRKERPLVSLDAIFAAGDAAVLEAIKPYLDVKSSAFMIQVRAFEGGAAQDLQVIAKRGSEGKMQVVSWVF